MMRLLCLVVLLFVSACVSQSPVAPDALSELSGEVSLVPMDFESGVIPWPQARSSFNVVASTGQVRVEGVFVTPMGGYTLDAVAHRGGSTIRIEVAAEQTNPGIAVAIPYWYDAVLRELPSGTYTLQVAHQEGDNVRKVWEQRLRVR